MEKNSISIWYMHMRTTRNLDLTQIRNETLIDMKKTNRTTDVQMSDC